MIDERLPKDEEVFSLDSICSLDRNSCPCSFLSSMVAMIGSAIISLQRNSTLDSHLGTA